MRKLSAFSYKLSAVCYQLSAKARKTWGSASPSLVIPTEEQSDEWRDLYKILRFLDSAF